MPAKLDRDDLREALAALTAAEKSTQRAELSIEAADDWEEDAELLEAAADRLELMERRIRGTYGVMVARGPQSLTKGIEMIGGLMPEEEQMELYDRMKAAATSVGFPFPGPG